MKHLINRKTGKKLTEEEAKALSVELKRRTGVFFDTHTCNYGYPTPEMAINATQNSVIDTYSGYTFLFLGTVHKPLEGYKVRAIVAKIPANFESLFPDYVVIG